MWNKKRSLKLSKLCTLSFMVILAAVLVGSGALINRLREMSFYASQAPRACFFATLFTGGAVAALLLLDLYRLLCSIEQGEVFIAQNVLRLRRISWYCIIGGGIALISALYYLPWVFVGIAAFFIGLIVRVVKNILAEANFLKQENDYTI